MEYSSSSPELPPIQVQSIACCDSKRNSIRCDWPFTKHCSKMLSSLSEMQSHKEEAHEYCSYCNLDFELYEDHHQHRIDMDESGRDDFHITCKHCGLNSKTRKARDNHVKRTHPVKQKLFCPICEDPEPFFDAVSFMKHIEEERCPRIDPEKLKTAHIHKQLIQSILKNPDGFQDVFQGDVNDSDSDDGGVSLLDSDIKEPLSDVGVVLIPSYVEALRGLPVCQQSQPKASNLGAALISDKEATDVTRDITRMNISRSSEAKVSIEKPSGYWNSKPKEQKLLIARDKSKSPKQQLTAWGTKETVKRLFPNAKPTPPTGFLESSLDNSTNILHHQFWNPNSPEYNPKMFFNPLREVYTCPFPTCRNGFDSTSDIKSHLKVIHSKLNLECPSCYVKFPRLSFFVHHVDYPGKRCRLIWREDFEEIVDKFTGGVLIAEPVWRDDCYLVKGVAWTVCEKGLNAVTAPRTTIIGRSALPLLVTEPPRARGISRRGGIL